MTVLWQQTRSKTLCRNQQLFAEVQNANRCQLENITEITQSLGLLMIHTAIKNFSSTHSKQLFLDFTMKTTR